MVGDGDDESAVVVNVVANGDADGKQVRGGLNARAPPFLSPFVVPG